MEEETKRCLWQRIQKRLYNIQTWFFSTRMSQRDSSMATFVLMQALTAEYTKNIQFNIAAAN